MMHEYTNIHTNVHDVNDTYILLHYQTVCVCERDRDADS